MSDIKNIVIDCDPGIDDALALIYAIKSNSLNLKAITVVSGNVPVHQGIENAYKVLDLLNENEIKVYRGSKSPLVRELVSAEDTHGDDGLGETEYTFKKRSNESTSAVDTLLNYASSDTHLIALGPLTNVALAMKKNPQRFNEYASITIMGGNYQSHGNCTKYSEYNFWVDPHAAEYVFKNTLQKLHLVPLDVTREILLTPEHRDMLKSLNTKISSFAYNITQYYVDFHKEWEGVDGCVINDPLAVACLENKALLSGIEGHVLIETNGEHLGRTTLAENSNQINAVIYTKVNAQEFFSQFFNTILT